jgi:hypothetical protein
MLQRSVPRPGVTGVGLGQDNHFWMLSSQCREIVGRAIGGIIVNNQQAALPTSGAITG